MEKILTLNYDPDGINHFPLKVGDKVNDLSDAIGLMQSLVIGVVFGSIGEMTAEEKAQAHLISLAIAAATAVEEPFTVKQKADMFADFLIAARAISGTLDIPDISKRKERYAEIVKALTEEYDAASATKGEKENGR